MQIRKQGNKIQLLRSVYNPALKKCKQVLLGSIKAYGDLQLGDDLLAELHEDEIKQFNDWVATEKETSIKLHNLYAIRHAEESIARISEAVIGTDKVDLVKIDSLKASIKGLQKVVRKAEKNLESASL